jgi:predicted phosphodiesterase
VIGLIADSHGDVDSTRQGIAALRARGAKEIYHLGDVADSLQRDTLKPLLDLLRETGVLAVKGNNDFALEKTLGQENGRLAAELKDLPVKRQSGDIIFSHSFPLETFRAFYDPVDDGSTTGAEIIFNDLTFRVHFCGHSHRPILFRWRGGEVTREAVRPGPTVLFPAERYIIVVGSVQEGELGLYDEGIYHRITREEMWKCPS